MKMVTADPPAAVRKQPPTLSQPPDTTLERVLRAVREAALDALAVLAPTECSGCGAPDRGICRLCRARLAPRPQVVWAARDGSVPVHSAVRYEGVVRNILLAFKENGRTDAARALALPAEAAVRAAIDASAVGGGPGGIGVEIATIPSTRAAFRARGYHPTELSLGKARMRSSRVLRLARQTDDQAGLGVDARSRNRSGALTCRSRLTGRRFIVVDDIVTSGATIREARRAIEAAGGQVIGAAAIAHTPLLRPAR